MAVKPIPDGYAEITPYLFIDGAAAAIDYYKTVFGAEERMRLPGPDGKIGHAELTIGKSVLMLADEAPDMGALGPKSVGGASTSIMVYVPDVDATFKTAVANGGKELQPVEDKFYGDRSGEVEDPFGHRWSISTHIEDVSEEEMSRRMQAFMSGGG
jgi:PhnB protein